MKILTVLGQKNRAGFTVVEIAVVIIVIVILVMATAVSWSQWQARTAKNEIKNDLTGVASSMESARNWSNGYPVLSPGTTLGANQQTRDIFTPSKNVTMIYRRGNSSSYCIEATSQTRSSIIMHIEVSGNRRIPEDGSC